MTDPGETTLDSIGISSQTEFTEPKKKRGRPSNAQKALEKAQKDKDERVFEERYALKCATMINCIDVSSIGNRALLLDILKIVDHKHID